MGKDAGGTAGASCRPVTGTGARMGAGTLTQLLRLRWRAPWQGLRLRWMAPWQGLRLRWMAPLEGPSQPPEETLQHLKKGAHELSSLSIDLS